MFILDTVRYQEITWTSTELFSVKRLVKICGDIWSKYKHFVHYVISQRVNTLRPRQNWRYFADDIFKCIFLNENAWISLKISLKFFPKVRLDNIPALVQIMAWRRPGDKPLSEPMMVSLLTHIWVTRPQWVKGSGACVLNLCMNVPHINIKPLQQVRRQVSDTTIKATNHQWHIFIIHTNCAPSYQPIQVEINLARCNWSIK